MKITIINKILLCFICSIVPYISKGQCSDSFKSVCLPDSIAEQIENNYEYKNTNASKNVVNLISPKNYLWGDGICLQGYGTALSKTNLCIQRAHPIYLGD